MKTQYLKLFTILTLFSAAAQASSVQIPNFDGETQDGRFTCWAAVTKMVLGNSFGKETHECTVITLTKGGECCGFFGGVKSECDKRGDVQRALMSYGHDVLTTTPDLNRIVRSIQNRVLPILHIDYNTNPATSHVIVVYGVKNVEAGSNAILEIFDPDGGYRDIRYGDMLRGYFGNKWTKLLIAK